MSIMDGVQVKLDDLSSLIDSSTKRYQALDKPDIHISQELSDAFRDSYNLIESNATVTVREYSILITASQLQAQLPSTWFWFGYAYWEFVAALENYKEVLDQLKLEVIEKDSWTAEEFHDFLSQLPAENPSNGLAFLGPDGEVIDRRINSFLSEENSRLFKLFLTDRNYWFKSGKGKKLSRPDVYDSCITNAVNVIAANAAKLPNMIRAVAQSKTIQDILQHYIDVPSETKNANAHYTTPARNLIFYGAPGTGKSYSISKRVAETNTIRTVFHPDTQFSDFVGCLKPLMQDDGTVGYGFRPGPFTEAVINAVNDQSHMYFLVIEEINRAAAAAVFGEIFQLLDRDATGLSSYTINISDPDLLAYLNNKTSNKFPNGKLFLPSNLSLFATMNSSDQAVMPLDTAFKRRWEFEYLPIDYRFASQGELKIPISDGSTLDISWANFARVINEQLASQRIPEDRLLGHRFISQSELSQGANSVLKGKLFMYLWDDVLRHGRHNIIFRESVESGPLFTFGQLANAFENGEAVFNEIVEDKFKLAAPQSKNNPAVEGTEGD